MSRRALYLREMGIQEWRQRLADAGTHVPGESASQVIHSSLDWPELAAQVSTCTACGLCQTRTQTVFGVGARPADWVVVGEAPGADEDARGEPFVGQAGKLLDYMLSALGLQRGVQVFITNVLKCRPPGNRDPLPAEIAQCEPFLQRQLVLLNPKIILVVGRFAAQTLLKTDAAMAKLRARVHQVDVAGQPVPVVATYHPAYLLRSPLEKAKTWQDLCLALQTYQQLQSTSQGVSSGMDATESNSR